MTSKKPEDLNALAAELLAAKAAESNAKDARTAVEARIYTAISEAKAIPERGTVNHGPFKISVGKSEKWDEAKLLELQKKIPPDQFPFITSLKCDKGALTKVAVDHPETYRKIFPCLTTKPNKPAFAVIEGDAA